MVLTLWEENVRRFGCLGEGKKGPENDRYFLGHLTQPLSFSVKLRLIEKSLFFYFTAV